VKTVKSSNMWPMSLAAQVCKDQTAGIHILDRRRNFDLHDRTAIIRTKLVQSSLVNDYHDFRSFAVLHSAPRPLPIGSNTPVPKQDNVRINVTLRRFRVTIVAVENQYLLFCIYVCS